MSWKCEVCGQENGDDAAESCLYCNNLRLDGEFAAPQHERVFPNQADEEKWGQGVWDVPPAFDDAGFGPISTSEVGGTSVFAADADDDEWVWGDSAEESPEVSTAAEPSYAPAGAAPVLELEEVRSRKRIVIAEPGGFIGREGDFERDFLDGFSHISRTHALLGLHEGTWTISHLGSNPTVLFTGDGHMSLARDVATPLHDGDSLRLADVTFRVHITRPCDTAQPCDAAQPTAARSAAGRPDAMGDVENFAVLSGFGVPLGAGGIADAPVSSQGGQTVEGWFIDCPPGGCGHSFRVANEQSHLAECPYCVDEMDRRRIARVRPVWAARRIGEFDDVRG